MSEDLLPDQQLFLAVSQDGQNAIKYIHSLDVFPSFSTFL